MNNQKVVIASKDYEEIILFLEENKIRKFLLVCGKTFPLLNISSFFYDLTEKTGIEYVIFDDFKPNPMYESVIKGTDIFNREKCQAIIVVGGGSAIDVAKCIKLYAGMNITEEVLSQPRRINNIKILAIPTTAGTGSEATRYAVIYYKGEKQSISDDSCVPAMVLFDVSTLKTLPDYQRKVTMLDALCHAIESYWSVNSTMESKEYSRKAISLILDNMDLYLANDEIGNANMFKAANLAGKAINISQTTAGHAMSYKLTSLYGIAHGHAAALCVNKLFPYMVSHIDNCCDLRGKKYLEGVFAEIADAMGCQTVNSAINGFSSILEKLNLNIPAPSNDDYDILCKSVNLTRLKNNPVELTPIVIKQLYHQILERT